MEQLAILGGNPLRNHPYPTWPIWDERERQALEEVLNSGQWGGFPYPGPQTRSFGEKFAQLQGGGYPVVMVNGTVTLFVALQAAGIGWGDEVIVPAYTFQATALAPILAGAVPVLVDVDPATLCIDVQAAEAAVTERTRAIIPVHLGAQMADMDAVTALAKQYNLVVIEDCAHAHGAYWRGQGAGTIGDFGSFSMQSSKTLTAGEGGLLLCRTEELAARAASLIDCGRPHDPDKQLYSLGGNFRLGEFQAALLNAALERFPGQVEERTLMADYLDEALENTEGIRLLRRDPRHTVRSFYRYIFMLDRTQVEVSNEVFCQALLAEGIPCLTGYPAMHQYELFQPGLSKLPSAQQYTEVVRQYEQRFPIAEHATNEAAVWLDERVFRAGKAGIDDAVAAIQKVLKALSSMETRDSLSHIAT